MLSGQTIGAEEALAIGLVDRVVAYEQLDAAIAEIIAAGRAAVVGRSRCRTAIGPIAEFFDRHGVDELLEGLATRPRTPGWRRPSSGSGPRRPVALRLAAELIDRGARSADRAGLALELSHLDEIFATKDAYEGLSSLGGRRRCSWGNRLRVQASGFRKSVETSPHDWI